MTAKLSMVETPLRRAQHALKRRELVTAFDLFKEALSSGASPDACSSGLWIIHMLRGEFEKAWHESDAIRRRDAPDPHRFWTGNSVKGKRVIVRCLHGLGDAVQLLRFVPMLQTLSESLIVEIPPGLMEIATCFRGVTHVTTWGKPCAPSWECQVEIVELPYLFRIQEHDLPFATNYVTMPQELLQRTTPRSNVASNPRVGLVWTSGAWNPSRSVPFPLLHPLLQVAGCEFWNLQGGTARKQWHELADRNRLHSADICSNSVLQLAAIIAQLDLIITTDTLAAHLAGALGTSAWVMLEFAADWRWMLSREDSPWYPSLRLFRQTASGDWHSVIDPLRAELISWIDKRKREHVA